MEKCDKAQRERERGGKRRVKAPVSLVSRKTSQIPIKAGSDGVTRSLRSWQGQGQMHIGFKVSKRKFLELLTHINVKVVEKNVFSQQRQRQTLVCQEAIKK